MDQGVMLAAYAKQIHDEDMERWVADIKIRARRKLGKVSKGLEKSKGGANPKSTLRDSATSKKETLAAAGISKDIAHRIEKIAAINESFCRA